MTNRANYTETIHNAITYN